MSHQDHRALAQELEDARQHRRPIPLPSDRHLGMSLADAYGVQAAWLSLCEESGRNRIGYKVGLTSRAMQIALKVDQPQYGYLTDEHIYGHDARIEAQAFFKPRLEIELAFVIAQPISGTGRTIGEVLAATRYIQPAIEIVDYRTVFPRPLIDMVADNVAGAGAILGGQKTRPDSGIDFGWVGATLARNGAIEESGVSAAVLGHPALGVVALLDRMAQLGLGLAEGEIVLSGSFTRQVDAVAGDGFRADFGELGAFEFRFE